MNGGIYIFSSSGKLNLDSLIIYSEMGKYHKVCGGEVEVIALSTPEPGIGYWCKKCRVSLEKNEVTELLKK